MAEAVDAIAGAAAQVTVETANPWPTNEQWQKADVAVMFSANPAWTPAEAATLDAYFKRGGGMVLLHYAVNGQRAPEEFARRVGLAWNPVGSRFRHGELELNFRQPIDRFNHLILPGARVSGSALPDAPSSRPAPASS